MSSSSQPSCGTPTTATTTLCARSTQSLSKLGLDYVDLYLIHWPMPGRSDQVDTWRALEKIYADGRLTLDRRLQFHRFTT